MRRGGEVILALGDHGRLVSWTGHAPPSVLDETGCEVGGIAEDGAVQQYEVGGTLQVSLDRVTGKLSTGSSTLVLTGTAPLWRCEATTISLHVVPAEALPAGATPIRIVLPASLTLKLDPAVASLSLAGGGPSEAYRSTIDRVDVDLVTSRDGKASVGSGDISIPVRIARYPVRRR